MEVKFKSTVKCPLCGYRREEEMLVNIVHHSYECGNCKAVIKPKEGDCCVYCSYGTIECPPIQKNSGYSN